MTDTFSIGFMLYFQAGLILLGYLGFRRIRLLRVQVLTLEADLDAASQNFEARYRAIALRAPAKNTSTPASSHEDPQAHRKTKREIALELAVSGMDAAEIAERLGMQIVEVELFLKASRHRKGDAWDANTTRVPAPPSLDLPGLAREYPG